MPTSITSDATITIENSLDAGPNYPDQNRPIIVLAVVAWVTYILRQLLQFTTSTLGLFEDDFISIRNRLAELEGESSDTDEDAPTSSKRPPGTTTTTKPSSKAPGTKKCNRCGASGHDTTDCRTRNPEMVKKRIANNKKAKKEADRLRSYPPPYAQYFTLPHLFRRTPADSDRLRRTPADSSPSPICHLFVTFLSHPGVCGLCWTPVDSGGLRRTPADSSRLQRNPPDSSGLQRTPVDSGGIER